jgi:hypothetical protein
MEGLRANGAEVLPKIVDLSLELAECGVSRSLRCPERTASLDRLVEIASNRCHTLEGHPAVDHT